MRKEKIRSKIVGRNLDPFKIDAIRQALDFMAPTASARNVVDGIVQIGLDGLAFSCSGGWINVHDCISGKIGLRIGYCKD